MRKFWMALGAFVIFAAAGVGLLVVTGIVILLSHHARGHAAELGGIAGGISGTTVLAVPLLCGAAGAGYVLYQLNRTRP